MSVDFEKYRKEEWPVLDTMTFLDSACVSFTPQRSAKALHAFVDMTTRQDEANSSAHHIAMDDMRGKAYVEGAKLLNADISEIAVVESTSHGLNIAANCIPIADGQNIVTTNLEFIEVVLPWTNMIKNGKKIDVKVVKTENNRFTVDDFAKVIDDKTAIVVISSVEWCNGWCHDLKGIGDYCKSRGIAVVLDAVQHMGVVKIDTKTFYCDFMVAGAHKWMNSPFGSCIMYVSREAQAKYATTYAGYLNCEMPPEGWGAYWENPAQPAVKVWNLLDSARKYEIGGTSNYCGAVALGETLGLINEIGIENITERVIDNGNYVMDELEKIGMTMITHRDKEHRSGTIIARAYSDLALEKKVLLAMHARKVFVALRFTDYVGGFRISCHYANNKKDFDAMVAAFKEVFAEIGKAPDYGN